MKKLLSIDISAKEYTHKAAGNSYFSAYVVLNRGLENEESFYLPFQYGYGDQYLCETSKQLAKQGFIPEELARVSITRFCRENGVHLRHNIVTGCKEKEVKDWGNP